MNVKCRLFIFISLAVFSITSNASKVWVNDQKLSSVWTISTGDFVIQTESSADPICQDSGKYFHVYENQSGVTSEGRKALLSTAMTALAAGSDIDIRYENSTSSCFVKELRIRN